MPAATDILLWSSAVLFSLVLAFAAVCDVRERRIPNWTVIAIAVLAVPWILAQPSMPFATSLAAAGIAFLVTLPLYAFRVVGAGDSKLATAVALFVGLHYLPEAALMTALAGGALAVFTLMADPKRALVMIQTRFKANYGRGIPYGVAIALAGIVTTASRVI